MARMARFVLGGYVHHVVQRSCLKKPIFTADQDFEKYIGLLAKHAKLERVDIWAYCILPGSIHLLVVPPNARALSNMIRDIHATYSGYYNALYDHSGTIWRGRFQSCVLDDPLVEFAARIVEYLPCRQRLAGRAEDYRWSSAAAHTTEKEHPFLTAHFPSPEMRSQWSAFLHTNPQADLLEDELQMRTRTGRPFGRAAFFQELEQKYNRSLAPKKRGRKAKSQKIDAAPDQNS